MQTLDIQQLEIALKKHGLSVTRARKEVFTLLLNAVAPMTVQEIILASDKLHFVSVYRTIETLLSIGVVKQVPIGFKNKYEVSDAFKPHHHHVTCEKCGISIAIHNETIENLMHQVTVSSGMKPTKHHFEAYGICEYCGTN
jgi:Fe2+ or Zn2+ uptake regulation protein